MRVAQVTAPAALTIVFGMLAASTAVAKAAPQMLQVGPGAFATIQDAVNAITEKSAEIMVAAGTYPENVSINPQTGSKPIKLTVTIVGAGSTLTVVDGGASGTVFTVGAKTTLTLQAMTIQNGNAAGGDGGGLFAQDATVTIADCELSGNTANTGGAIAIDDGALTVTGSTITGNTTSGSVTQGGGIFFETPHKSGKLTITDSTISANSAGQGAGIFAVNPSATLSGDTISGNTAVALLLSGGGSSAGDGAGIVLGGGKLTIVDSTISGNAAEAGSSIGSGGGGVFNDKGKVTLNNVTIADNTASTGGGIDTGGGKSFKTSNSIIANNTGGDCSGTIDSTGYNLIFDTTGCSFSGKSSTDITGEDPLLEPLTAVSANVTATQAPGAGSPALKAGNPGTPNGKGGHCLANDQIGNPRAKSECDIGAMQVSGVL